MPEQFPALDPNAILLHVGPHKTGTTAIQGMLGEARPALAEHGVLYPGKRSNHHDEARALLGRASGWAADQDELPPVHRWNKLARAAQRAPGRVVISSEFFGLAHDEHRATMVEQLGADRLHVLVAARNPGAIALSTWQQVLRDGKGAGLDDWLQRSFKREAPGPATAGFWWWADAAKQVERWARVLPADHIHVVVIDEADRTLLPTTFEQLLGVPAGVIAGATSRSHSNRSLTAPEAELLRAVVAIARPELTWKQFSLLLRFGYSRRLVSSRTPAADEPRMTLPAWAVEQADREAEAMVEQLGASGVHLIGDLAHLRQGRTATEPVTVDAVPVELAAEGVTGVAVAAARRIEALEQQLEQLRASRPAIDDIPTRDLAAHLRRRALRRARRGGRTDGRRP
ncbi:hypothetical protein L615_000900000600 [Nocardioides sp. J9]|uniref:hypothetical protein n=1 Tax=unclassified Nocardioides TaxID=2615069 RepID=UPI0004AE9046|nr:MULTISPECIES: hypothetical protein [unclassified Nocardioides]TWG90613.1 hypothetical protein L615_000900000600 [Nocardioides sp. J9]